MAIGSAAIPFNINFVLDNLNIRSYFKAIVSAEDVANSKPDPETFTKGAEILGVAANQCIVFEDAVLRAKMEGFGKKGFRGMMDEKLRLAQNQARKQNNKMIKEYFTFPKIMMTVAG